jgi:excinuclease ABC subunit B
MMRSHRGPGQFEVVSPFKPTGDQPAAIEKLTQDLRAGRPAACLLGATGTGKTFTMANTIARLNKPTLIISHNKTLRRSCSRSCASSSPTTR